MIPCSMDCVHQTEGYCALSGGARVTNTVSACPHYVGRRQEEVSSIQVSNSQASNEQRNRLTDSTHIAELNRGGNLSAH